MNRPTDKALTQATSPATGKDHRSRRERAERVVWRAAKPLLQRVAGRVQQQHLFVAGMQRSGTNMLMEVLEWSRPTDVYHETDPRTFDNYQMRPRSQVWAVAGRSPAPVFVIKCLCELDQVRTFMDEFAPSRVVWLIRAFDDTVNSAIRSFGNFRHQALRLAKDKTAAEWRGRGMSDETQAHLRRLVHPDMNEASAAALMWYYRNVLFFEQGLDADARAQALSYERLVASPGPTVDALLSAHGLPPGGPWLTRYVHVRSVGKSPRADIEPGVRVLCDGLLARFRTLGGLAAPGP